MNYLHFLYAYLLGGVTFIPFLIILFFLLHKKKYSNEAKPPSLKAGEIKEQSLSGLDAFKQGWITLTHEFLDSLDHISSKTQPIAESLESKSAYSSLYKLVKNSNPRTLQVSGESAIEDADMIEQHVPSRNTKASAKILSNKKHRYFAVLKHGNLFLYNNEKLKDVKHVIVLSNYLVCLWPRTLTDGSLYSKYSAIAILKKDWSRVRRLSDNIFNEDWEGNDESRITIKDVVNSENDLPAPPGSFFLHTDVNIDKEDWYFSLIKATKTETHGEFPELDPKIFAKTLHFETKNMVNLIQKLYSSEGQLHSKWFNALIGRIFLSLQGTDFMNDYLVTKIEKKLNKIKMPGFFDKFQIIEVRPGDGAPFFTFPVLKEINPEGDLVVSMYMHYFGGMSMQIATKMNLSLGSRFKNREVDVLLSMTLEKIQGPMLIKIKAPPSCRLWYTFEQEPTMSVKIEPVISARQMSYNIITNSIEKKLKESIKESLVLPHWDDLSFYDTTGELYRGGLWDKESRNTNEREKEQKQQDQEETKDEKSGNLEASSVRLDTSDMEQDPDEYSLIAVSMEDDSESVRSSSISISREDFNPKSSKIKLSSTFGDLSKRLRKAKSTHSTRVDETNCLSDGSLEHKRGTQNTINTSQTATNVKNSALKKIGNWYSREETSLGGETSFPQMQNYNRPEMISNRRQGRRSVSTTGSDPDLQEEQERELEAFAYDFGSEINDTGIIPKSIEPHIDQTLILSESLYVPLRELEMSDSSGHALSMATSTNSHGFALSQEKLFTPRRRPPPNSLNK